MTMNPQAINAASLDPEVLKKEREIAEEQTRTANAGKPENIVAKIVEGRVNAVLKEICLENQDYIVESGKTVGKVAEDAGLKLKKFHRWVVSAVN